MAETNLMSCIRSSFMSRKSSHMAFIHVGSEVNFSRDAKAFTTARYDILVFIRTRKAKSRAIVGNIGIFLLHQLVVHRLEPAGK